ncbi:YfjI family protein [Streptomyces sp. NBC_00237]|uniref:hypothetical protein n=1 Tax=Streptomyces sp. NBC_00237 TaxID=2975687 RepID=UPI00224E5B25|nr:hypothetical protein [Streptomyces sp. NBC_00237]MCX5201475.1 YfjI family protein [Streptomyces sp. NBC_00237]
MDEEQEEKAKQLPTFEDMAYGPMGKAVRKAMPHTEGDPVAVLAVLLALFSGLVTPYVTQPSGRPCVVWTALVGPSNQGAKGYAYNTGLRILGKPFERILRAVKLSAIHSGPGLVSVLASDQRSAFPGRMYLTFEWSNDMGRTNKCSSYGEVMINIWDGESISNTIKGRGPGAEPVEEYVANPLMGFHAHVQPRTLQLAVKPQRAATGLYNRFLLFSCKRSQRISEHVQRPLDEIKASKALADAFRWVMEEQPAMEWSSEAVDALDELHRKYDALIDELPPETGVFIERSVEQIKRVATVLAVTQQRTVIPAAALSAAEAIVDYAAQSATEVMGEQPSTRSRARPLPERILEILAKNGGAMTRSQMVTALGGGRVTKQMLDDALKLLPQVRETLLPAEEGKSGPRTRELRVVAPSEGGRRPALRVVPQNSLPTSPVRRQKPPTATAVRAAGRAPAKKKTRPKGRGIPQTAFSHLI